MTAVDPPVALNTRGQALWDHFADDPPFWWDPHDVYMAGLLCATTDQVVKAFRSNATSAAGKAAIVKEARSIADQLGLSPTARSRLKMTEAQAVTAAKRVEAMEEAQREHERRDTAIDLDELVGDDDD